jgi:hypothetical protein
VIPRVEARFPGIVIVVLGVLFCVGALSYGVVNDGRMGPGLMPMVSGLGLVVLGTMIAVTARPDSGAVTAGPDIDHRDPRVGGNAARVVGPTEGEPVEEQVDDDGLTAMEVHHPAHPWLILGATAAALLVAPLVGLIPALGLMSLVLLRFVERESWLLSLVVTVALVITSWLVFEELLEVNVPWGVFEGLL